MSEIKSQFFNGKTYSATDFVESNKNTMTDGILPNTDFFKVLPASNMTIGVTSGRGWVQGHAFSSDSTLSFTLNNTDGVLDRIDTVIIRLDLTTGNEKIECRVIKGDLGGSATAPVRDGTYYDLVIAQIAVAHGTTAITAGMITDKRGDGNLCGWSGAISGDQFIFDVKADKTYCNATFATKTEITAGTLKANADRLLGKIISFPRTGVLTNNASGITVLNPGVTLANSTVSQAWMMTTIGIINPGYTVFRFSYKDPVIGDIYKDSLITIGELNGLVISVTAGGGNGYVTITLTNSAITLTLNMNTYINCTINLVGLF